MKKSFAILLSVLLVLSLCAPVLATTPEEEAASVTFTLERLPQNLEYMGVGMLCIIIVMGVLILATMLLNRVTAPKKKQ